MIRPHFVRTSLLIFATVVLMSGCAASESKNNFSYKDLPVSKGNAVSGEGNTVAFKGAPLKLEGNTVRWEIAFATRNWPGRISNS